MKKILLIEDDQEIRTIQKDYLLKQGYKVIEAQDGQKALDLFESGSYDLLVLDLNLPIIDGVSVCKKIRKKSQIPIIMVTARTSEIDEVRGLEVGADDYVTKPFSPRVLVARIKALLKRPTALGVTNIIKRGDIEVDLEKQTVKKNHKKLKLTNTQFNILVYLMKHPGKVFTREALINRAYDKVIPPDVFDRTIDSHIKNIRRKIEDDTKNPKYILTIRGKGYSFTEQEE